MTIPPPHEGRSAHQDGAGERRVVDDRFGEAERVDLGEVEVLAGLVPVPVEVLGFGSPFEGDVAFDSAGQRHLAVDLHPDEMVPVGVVLGALPNTESTIRTASSGAVTVVSRWSSPVSGSCAQRATTPEPVAPAGSSRSSRALSKSGALR